MSNNDELEKKKKEFWKLQLRLNRFVGETERELDPAIKKILKNIPIPDWFNSGIVFSPLILALDVQIQTLEDEIVSSQETLKQLYQSRKTVQNEVETKLEREIVDLYKQIDTIKNEIEEIRNAKQGNQQSILQNQYQIYFETEINRCKEDLSAIQKEDQ